MISNTETIIEKFELKNKILDMYREGQSYNKISQTLSEQGFDISPKSISAWITKQTEKFRESSSNSLKNLERFEGMIVKYDNEIKAILEEVKEMKDIAKEQGKLETYAKLVDRLYRGLELLGKFMGDIKPDNSVDIKVMLNEINKAVFDDKKGNIKKVFTNDDEKIFDADYVIKKEESL